MQRANPIVANASQAALLLNERYADVINVLAGDGASASQVAKRIGKPLSSVHTQLKSLLGVGIIYVHTVHPRAGRPIKEYRLYLPWHIPFAVTPATSLRDLLADRLKSTIDQQMDALAMALERVYDSPDWFVNVDASEGSLEFLVQNVALGQIATQPIVGISTELHLTPEKAILLKERLNMIFSEFSNEQTSDDSALKWSLLLLLTPPQEK